MDNLRRLICMPSSSQQSYWRVTWDKKFLITRTGIIYIRAAIEYGHCAVTFTTRTYLQLAYSKINIHGVFLHIMGTTSERGA